MYNRKIPKDFLKVGSINGPSCNDLNGCDCEGWLWFKKKSFVARWCILRSNWLRLLADSKDMEECEAHIKILNSQVSLMKKSKSPNFYFKIRSEDNSFMFGTESKSDFYKWLNKLHLSAAGIEIDEKDGPVGGFTSGYILKTDSFTKVIGIADSNEQIDEGRRDSESGNDDSAFQYFPDKRLKALYNRSTSESSNYNSKSFHPIPPPRKYSYNKGNSHASTSQVFLNSNTNKVLEDGHSISQSVAENDDIYSEIKHLPISNNTEDHTFFNITAIDDTPKKLIHSSKQSSTSKQSSKKSLSSQNHSQNDNNTESQEFMKNSKMTDGIEGINVNIDTESNLESDFRINSIQKIAELERLIRDKYYLLSKIDQVLRSSHLAHSVQEFWDDNGEEILTINANHLD